MIILETRTPAPPIIEKGTRVSLTGSQIEGTILGYSKYYKAYYVQWDGTNRTGKCQHTDLDILTPIEA